MALTVTKADIVDPDTGEVTEVDLAESRLAEPEATVETESDGIF